MMSFYCFPNAQGQPSLDTQQEFSEGIMSQQNIFIQLKD